MKAKRILSITLTLVMSLGMFPGMSLTASAADNATTITPGTDDAKTGTGTMTITLVIKGEPATTDFDVTLPTSLAYDGTAKTVSAAAKSAVTGMGTITVEYYRDGVKVDNAVNVGDYTVKLNVAAGTHYNAGTVENADWKFSITKGTPAVTAPTAKNLTYTGSAQELVTAGSATGGTMQYALGTDASIKPADSAYVTSIPTATNAGTYTVWYKVAGDADHTDTAAQSLTVTISPKRGEEKSDPDPDPTPTPDPDPTPAEDKTTAVIGDGDNAKAKSISELLSDKSLDQKEITTAKIENASSLASLSGIGKLEKLETLSISGANNLTDISEVKTLKNLKTLDVSSCPSLETANLSGNTSLTEVKMNECEALTELDVSNCPELVSLDVSSGDLKTLNVNGCSNLASLNCASNTLPALDLSACTKLTSLDCSENSLLSLDLSSLGSLASVDCHGQYRGDLISTRQSDGTWRVELPEGLASGTVRIAAAGFVAASVRAYDEAGNLLTPTTAGTYTDQPVRITYNYNTGYNDGEKEVLMDVTLSGEPSGPTGPTSNKGSGGCDTIGLGGVALMTLAGLAFKNRRWRRSRCFARS